MSEETRENTGQRTRSPWDSTAHGPVRESAHGPVHATYSPSPGDLRAAVPLLELITRQSLDEDYQHVAERRRREQAAAAATRQQSGSPEVGSRPTGRPLSRSGLTIAVVLVFGLLVAVAAVQTSRNASVDNASKDQLISRINTRHAAVASLQKQIAALRASTTREETAYGDLGRSLDAATSTQDALSAATGWASVRGAGVRATLDDAPSGGTSGQVRDSDLAGLVNGLWQAGATAISVNGQRVTPLSALRNTATVVRINDTSLSPPYTVLALGDTKMMQAKFAQTVSGIRLRNLTNQYGMPFSMQNESNLMLPAAPSSMLVLRHARADHGPVDDKEKP